MLSEKEVKRFIDSITDSLVDGKDEITEFAASSDAFLSKRASGINTMIEYLANNDSNKVLFDMKALCVPNFFMCPLDDEISFGGMIQLSTACNTLNNEVFIQMPIIEAVLITLMENAAHGYEYFMLDYKTLFIHNKMFLYKFPQIQSVVTELCNKHYIAPDMHNKSFQVDGLISTDTRIGK